MLTLDKLLQHYHFLKKNKNVNVQEFVWCEKPRNFYSSRFHDMLLEASLSKPEFVQQMLSRQSAICDTYLFEACIRTNSMVQSQVFCHHLLGLLRLTAANESLFNQFVDVFLPIIFKQIIVLTFQADQAAQESDEEFANYSRTLARRVCDCALVFGHLITKHARTLATNGKLQAIINCPELEWIT